MPEPDEKKLQRQDSLKSQLNDVLMMANKAGCYDASDFIQRKGIKHLTEIKEAEQRVFREVANEGDCREQHGGNFKDFITWLKLKAKGE